MTFASVARMVPWSEVKAYRGVWRAEMASGLLLVQPKPPGRKNGRCGRQYQRENTMVDIRIEGLNRVQIDM
jgi:hypothetical protein